MKSLTIYLALRRDVLFVLNKEIDLVKVEILRLHCALSKEFDLVKVVILRLHCALCREFDLVKVVILRLHCASNLLSATSKVYKIFNFLFVDSVDQ